MKDIFKRESKELTDKKLITETLRLQWLVERVAKSLDLQTVRSAERAAKRKDALPPSL